MMTTKSVPLHRLVRTPFTISLVATLASLGFATLINVLFMSPQSLPMTLLITFVIAAPMSYLTIKIVVSLRSTLEDQKVKLALEHERAEILSKFMRDAAHEFKTPLALMSSNLYLSERTTDPQKKQAYMVDTNVQIDTINGLLETILVLTRLDSTDKGQYILTPVNAKELLSDIRSFNRAGRINLRVKNADALPSLCVNLSDLHFALKQIVGNALRYSPDNSEVLVEIIPSGHSLILQITDYGSGMDSETIQHIFDRFYRVDASHTTRGLGLGLAIAKRVIELHNGHIEVQSDLGKGTTFKVYLPANPPQ